MRNRGLLVSASIGLALALAAQCRLPGPEKPAEPLKPEPAHTVLKEPQTGGCGIVGAVVERTEARPDNTLLVYTYNRQQKCHAVSAWHGRDVYERFSYCSPGSIFPGCRTDM
jgi:hypothetical protein